jgi:hypothetical protein
MGLEKLEKKDSQRLERYFSGLPSKKLQKLAKSLEAQAMWLQVNNQASLLGKCLAARARRAGGDPIKHLKDENSFQYLIIWQLTTHYETFFDLIQLCWDSIREILKCLEDSPQSELSLFMTAMAEIFDGMFAPCVEGGITYNPHKDEKFFRLHLRLTGHYPKSQEQDLSPTGIAEYVDLASEALGTGTPSAVFYPLLLKVFAEESRHNDAVKTVMHPYMNESQQIADLMHQEYIKARKKGVLRSERWDKSGNCMVGTRGGRYVTKLS